MLGAQQVGDVGTVMDAGDEQLLGLAGGEQRQPALHAQAAAGQHDDGVGGAGGITDFVGDQPREPGEAAEPQQEEQDESGRRETEPAQPPAWPRRCGPGALARHGMRASARSTVTRAVTIAMKAAAKGSSASSSQCHGAISNAGSSRTRWPSSAVAAAGWAMA